MEAKASAALERGRRVLEAAHVPGCSAIAVQVPAAESDKAADLVVERVRRVSERAEQLDLNLLLSPCHGLTSAPDRLTDLIKRIGGFRVGTYPDFQAAAGQNDPGAYLRRLAPYAAAVCGATVKFVVSRGGGRGDTGDTGRRGTAVRPRPDGGGDPLGGLRGAISPSTTAGRATLHWV